MHKLGSDILKGWLEKTWAQSAFRITEEISEKRENKTVSLLENSGRPKRPATEIYSNKWKATLSGNLIIEIVKTEKHTVSMTLKKI